jgi:lipid II isoglutaminyl synthase (glutamine-hydrolysing)
MSDKQKITLLYLYPNEMNIYGDIGNVRTLAKRLEWRGYEAEIIYHHPGKEFTYEPDIIVGGGGQDSGQLKVANDLQHIGYKLHALATDGTPMLMICGMYQLFGRKFITSDNQELPGIRVFNMETRATEQRLIGPLVLDTKFGEVVGYENHSGQTILGTGQEPFGKVKKGFGNTSEQKFEGAITNNVYGSYLHGSVLPKNPKFADELLRVGITRRYGEVELKQLDDKIADEARRVAARR